MEEIVENTLSKIYYDPNNNGSFSSVNNLYKEAKKTYNSITLNQVKEWLASQLTYTLHKSVKKTFKRNRIVVSRIDEQWEADLVDMKEFSKKNKNFCYILTVIDCFSKYAFAIPLKVKTGDSIKLAFKKIFENRRPLSLRTDKGKEFINSVFQKFLKQNLVNYFHSNDTRIKCAIVERFNRTLKSRMFKYFTANGTRKYLDVLPKLLNAYNSSTHRSIKMKPSEVTKENSDYVFNNLYNKTIKLVKPKLNVGDKVRKIYDFKIMDRGYYPNWTDEVYTIEKTIKGDNNYMYRIKDGEGNIFEQRFYPQEIQKITDSLYRIEKIIKTRTKRGRKEYFVKWLNYPESYNSWVDNIQDGMH